MSKNSSTKVGRPAKMSLDDKKSILHRFLISVGPNSYSTSRLHGIFSKLANFARLNGCSDVESYDFANDKDFRAYLIEYLSAENDRNTSHSDSLSYTPLDIRSVVKLGPNQLGEILQQRESDLRDLYDSAIRAVEHYKALEDQIRTLRDEVQRLKQERDDLESKVCQSKDVISELKCDVRSAKEGAIYWQARAKEEIGKEAQAASKSPVPIISASMRFSSLIEQDRKMRKASTNSPEVIDFMDKLEERLKEKNDGKQ